MEWMGGGGRERDFKHFYKKDKGTICQIIMQYPHYVMYFQYIFQALARWITIGVYNFTYYEFHGGQFVKLKSSVDFYTMPSEVVGYVK